MSNQSIYLSGDWTFGAALQISAQRTKNAYRKDSVDLQSNR
jgi:hypothetical protein